MPELMPPSHYHHNVLPCAPQDATALTRARVNPNTDTPIWQVGSHSCAQSRPEDAAKHGHRTLPSERRAEWTVSLASMSL